MKDDHDIPALLGKPMDAPAVVRFLGKPPKPPTDEDDDVLTAGSEARGYSMELVRAADYDAEFATRAAAKNRQGWVVAGVDLYSTGANTKKTRAYPHALPFGISFGDTADALVAKIGQRPSSKSAGTYYAHAWWFRIGDAKLLAALDAKKRVMWLRIVPLDRETARAIARKASLSTENAHLRPACTAALAKLDRKRPTAAWKKRGDAMFTRAALADADALLDTYREALAAAAAKQSAAGVLAAVKRVVVGFNALNKRHGAVVETLEREELAAHIDALVRATGFRVQPGEDITAEWRGW